MKSILIWVSLVASIIRETVASDCAYITKGSFFDLGPLRNTSDDYEIKFNPANPSAVPTHTLYFNFCGKADEQCKLPDGKDTRAQAVMVGKDKPEDEEVTCKALTPGVGDFEFKIVTEITHGITNSQNGFRLFFNNTKTSLGVGNYYNFQIDLLCNDTVGAAETKFKLQSIIKSQETGTEGQSLSTIIVQAESKYGCPLY